MRPFRTPTRWIACLAAGFLASISAHAQVSDMPQRAANLVAATSAGYNIKMLVLDPVSGLDPCLGARFCGLASLPVDLVKFTGKRVSGEMVLLNWETSQETGSDYFQVERTLNPRLGFENVATVKAKGTTSSSVSYQTYDINKYNVYTYYRLKQVDLDGTHAYSTIIAVKGDVSPLTVIPYPNPVQGQQITFKTDGLKQSEQTSLIVYEVQGKIVYRKNYISSLELRDVKTQLPNLPAGFYTVKVISGDREATAAFVIVP